MAKRLSLLVVALLLALAPAASATQARIDSMGGNQRSWTVEDETNIFDFPSLLVRYGNQTYVDNLASGLANTRFGFHYSLSDDMVLGIYGGDVSTDTRPVDSDQGDTFDVAGNSFTGDSALSVGGQSGAASFAQPGGTEGTGVVSLPASVHRVDLKMGVMLALNLGATMRLGFALNILGDNDDRDLPDTGQKDQGATLIDFAGGIGVDLSGSELELSLGLEYGTFEDFQDTARLNFASDVSNQQGNGDVPGDLSEHWTLGSHLALRISGRWTFDFVDQSDLVIYTRLHNVSEDISHLNTGLMPIANANAAQALTGTWGGFDFVLGADMRLNPFEDVIVIPGVGLRYAQVSLGGTQFAGQGNGTQTDRDVDRLVSLPFYGVGVDVKIYDWLDFRFGTQQSVDFYRNSVTTVQGITTTNRTSDVTTDVASGVGLHFPIAESLLSIDINVNPTWWMNGPDFFSGNGGNGTFGLTSAIKYDW